MPLRQVIEAEELLDDPGVSGQSAAEWLAAHGVEDVTVQRCDGATGGTDFLRAVLPGNANGPTLGLIGRLGGLGARPEQVGLVSDSDGALTVLAVAAKLGRMRARGDALAGTVIVSTHICPQAPTRPHDPVPFMDSPVDIATMNRHEIDARMDAVISVDATKGNRICTHTGFAITPTVKQGWLLRVREQLLDLAATVSGSAPAVFPLTTQDITPYGNGAHHVNSILQPSCATDAPVLGLAITTESVVPGSATGASHMSSVESATRFCIEVAKQFGAGSISLHDEEEFQLLVRTYGSLGHLHGTEATT